LDRIITIIEDNRDTVLAWELEANVSLRAIVEECDRQVNVMILLVKWLCRKMT